ncbi:MULTISPECIES: ACP-like domain-containing protein [unclassified Lonepinella]|uniref:ACP-like domain-containing protein n=1 Tax=unclassified Lonepinella TaxID=2642006 RepID=UPI0036D8E5A6
MKLVKFIPAICATVVLAACSSAPSEQEMAAAQAEKEAQVMEQAMNTADAQATEMAKNIDGTAQVKVQKVPTVNKSVVYRCQSGKVVTATYAFENNDPRAVSVRLGKGQKALKVSLARDDNSKDTVSFVSDKYEWNVDTGLTLDNFNGVDAIHLVKKGAESDQILAKLCNVNKTATKRLNK